MYSKQKLANPYFISAVLVLVFNDWYLKQALHNQFTGKLSDFAGLFAFPFFLSAIWPVRKHLIYVGSAVFFIVWKSLLMQPLLDTANTLGLPFNRVIDYTDCWALMILPLSYYAFNNTVNYRLKPVLLNAVMVLSAVSFVATSMPKGKYEKFTGINKVYSFNFSKRELVSRINTMQLEYVKDMQNFAYSNNRSLQPADTVRVDFDSKANLFYYSSTHIKKDTLARILDYERLKDADTIRLHTMFSDINISGNNSHAELKLLSLNNYVRKNSKGNDREKSISIFERFVIKKIRSYGK